MTNYAQDVFYYGGKTFGPGDEIEPSSSQDLKDLQDKGLIGKDRPEPLKSWIGSDAEKAKGVSEQTKVNRPAEENKGKAKA